MRYLLIAGLAVQTVHSLPKLPHTSRDLIKTGGSDVIQYAQPNPNEPIVEWTAIGDSYTAGIGSNGPTGKEDGSKNCARYNMSYPDQMNSDDRWGGAVALMDRKLNFGACTGDVMVDVTKNQLSQQAAAPYKNFGKPAIVTMTISGNDLGFSSIVKACIYRPTLTGNCEDSISDAEKTVASQDFASRIDTVITDVVNAGRKSFGPTFQLYMNTYVPFFNETDEGCDTISYTWYFPFHDYDLTRAKRARLNKLTDALNGQIKAAVDRRSNQGVFLVTGYQDAYVGHQFCDPRAGDLNKPIENSVWFWHSKSPWDNTEGPDFVPNPSPADQPPPVGNGDYLVGLDYLLLEALIPDKGQQELILKGEKFSWDFNEAFLSEDNLLAAMDKLESGGEDKFKHLKDYYMRVFHPKGSAYKVQAMMNIDVIAKARGVTVTIPTAARSRTAAD